MASYARTEFHPASKQANAIQMKSQVSVLAQAKPAIISTTAAQSNEKSSTGALSERLRFAQDHQAAISKDLWAKFNSYEQKQQLFSHRHIEDENVIQKQNASNQMRQAAVLAAVASQQKVVRLSATERLALTAKKPQPEAAARPNQSSTTALPTLETLLAVQRQLQHHTQQSLSALPQQLQQQQMVNIPASTTNQAHLHRNNKPLPPSPPAVNQQQLINPPPPPPPPCTYEKELPPLPESPESSSSDESQLNSLDSQCSPSNSLVSIPPPPPPLSSYLQQYDEVSDFQLEAPAGGLRFPMPNVKPSVMLNYQQHLFTRSSPLNSASDETDGGADIRFPTPPPLSDLAFGCEEEEEDLEFECKIPTPPLYNKQPNFNSSTFAPSTNSVQPPPLFRQQPAALTVHISQHGELPAGLLSTASNQPAVNQHMMMTMAASSSSPSSSSDGDGHSSNSSSSTSGIHSNIDSPSSSNSKLDDFNYALSSLKLAAAAKAQERPAPAPTTTTATARRPALKQKKSVHFSDKVELVACAEEQTEDHLPNPLLARVLARKLQ